MGKQLDIPNSLANNKCRLSLSNLLGLQTVILRLAVGLVMGRFQIEGGGYIIK